MARMLPTFYILLTFALAIDAKSAKSSKSHHHDDDVTESPCAQNERPIIGILSQEIGYSMKEHFPHHQSYIAASYVKFIEGSGARVVPIWIGQDERYYEDLLSKINGVLFPGGRTYFNQSNGYAEAGAMIYKIAKRFNDRGDHFPIFGICLGFELLTYVAADNAEHRSKCHSMNQPARLEFTSESRKSKMFDDAPTNVMRILKTQDVTSNQHIFCVTENDLEKVNLTDEFLVTSTSKDWDDNEFIASLEHRNYPFYGIQFHPEKNAYEWAVNKGIPHGHNANLITQYFGNFFVNEARKNFHRFLTMKDEEKSLIYNFQAVYTAPLKSIFEQCYFFKKHYFKV